MNDTIRIDLGEGHAAVIDAADAPTVAGIPWRLFRTQNGRLYAYAWWRGRTIYMHRLIAATPDGLTTDHANGDGLDNRRSNLRNATWAQNSANVAKKLAYAGRKPTSRYKGVSWDRQKKKWHARARVDGRTLFLGRYDSEVEAARAYDAAAHSAWGEFAVLNFPDEVAA